MLLEGVKTTSMENVCVKSTYYKNLLEITLM